MKVIEQIVPQVNQFSIGFIGDVQCGPPGFSNGAFERAVNAFKRVRQQTNGAPLYIVGVGDYVDFMSPSNRAAYNASGIYSSSKRLIDSMVAGALVKDVTDMFKRLDGDWVVL